MKKLLYLIALVLVGCVPFSDIGSLTEQQLYAQWDALPHYYPEPYITQQEYITASLTVDSYTPSSIYQGRLDRYNNYRSYNSQAMTFQEYMAYMLGE